MTDFARLPPYRVSFTYSPLFVADGVDWGVSSYGVPSVWAKTRGAGVKVAVVDSGVAAHPALDDAVIDRKNFSPDDTADDTLGHGTHVAGIIGARRGPAKGIAPECSILSCKALGHSGIGSNHGVAEAVEYATRSKVDIISMSLGSSNPDSRLHSAIKAAVGAGIIVVCAAGNDAGPVDYPAAFPETIAVGAVRRDGEACMFSCRGSEIVVAAPGEDITSTWVGLGYATISGTSMAAPFVSGVLALYLSDAKRRGRLVTPAEAQAALESTATDAGDPGKDSLYGWGLVNPSAMMGTHTQDVP